jgi:hypothetical protein
MRNPHHHPLRPPPVVIPAKAGIHNPYPSAERTAPTNSTVSGYSAKPQSLLLFLQIMPFYNSFMLAGREVNKKVTLLFRRRSARDVSCIFLVQLQ